MGVSNLEVWDLLGLVEGRLWFIITCYYHVPEGAYFRETFPWVVPNSLFAPILPVNSNAE